MRIHLPLLLAGLLVHASAQANGPHHHHAHVHGQAKLEVAVSGAELSLHLHSPLEAVLGFEHAPRTAAQRSAVDTLRQTVAAGGRLFAPTAAAGCTFVEGRMRSDVLDGKPGAGKDGHGDMSAEFRFQCAQPARLTGLEVRLFDVFPRLRRVDAEVVSERGQTARRLTTRARALSW